MLVVAGVVGVVGVVVAAIAIVAVTSSSATRTGPSRSLTSPSTVGGHPILTGPAAEDVKARVQDAVLRAASKGDQLFQNARVEVYGPATGAVPAVLFVGVSASDSAKVAGLLHGETDRAHTNEVMQAFTDVNEFDPGPLGGSLRCGYAPAISAACAWADYSTLGVLFFYDGTSPNQAASTSVDFRAQAEH